MKNVSIDNGTELKRQRGATQKNKYKFYRFKFKSRNMMRKHPDKTFLITMFFKNGTSKTFSLATSENVFTFKNKTYMLYYEESWFDLSMNWFHLYYFENMAVPINREIQAIGEEAFFNVKPDNLKNLIRFEYVKVLAGAHSFDRMLKIIILLQFVNVVISIITAFMTYSGNKAV